MSRCRLIGKTSGVLVGSLVFAGSAAAIPNPAQVFCLEMGYAVDDGYCVFPDGNSCELWAFLRGECGAEYVHPVPCAEAGEHRGVAVECCEGLVEISNAYPEDYVCQPLLGAFPLCSACGDGNCDDWENACNCWEDCGPCVGEGGTISATLDPPVCCMGLALIPPMDPNWYGIHGICTANCGDGVCNPAIETPYNCPEDCPCVEEGGTIPAVPYPPECCPGLELIPPMCPGWFGIYGYCAANCGDGVCDPAIETDYNCPEDCPDGTMEGCFAGCGVLGRGPQTCTIFQADSGEAFAVGNTGGFWVGDHVYVAGLVVEDSLMCWPARVPGIGNNAISACFAGFGVLGRGPQNCSIVFQADVGRTFTLDNIGDFRLGDRVYVTGALNENSVDCWPVTTPAIEDNTIQAWFAGCGVIDWRGPQSCSLFRTDTGQAFTLENWGNFTHGDRIYVTGVINEDSLRCWPVSVPAIEDNTIRACPVGHTILRPEGRIQGDLDSDRRNVAGPS